MNVKTAKAHLRILGFVQVEYHTDVYIRLYDSVRVVVLECGVWHVSVHSNKISQKNAEKIVDFLNER